MKVILIGYTGSQCIVPASKYLTNKYLPDFCKIYLNYKGEINGWAIYLAGFLEYLPDEDIVFALDDYLIANEIDLVKFADALCEVGGDVVCAKLCQSTPDEHDEYPVTTQYTIWNREYLIELLGKVNTPWEFEIKGSAIFKQGNKKVLHRPCLEYFTNSSISGRWEGVRLDGLKDEDIKYIKENLL
jgi:hypothetical protein